MKPFPRQRTPEWMDADTADADALRASLDFIERVNRWLGYTRATIGHLDRLTADWPVGRPMDVLDVATGSADVPRAICAWADRRRIDARAVGIDLHPLTLSIARERTPDPRITLLRGDALRLPFADNSFDFVLCSMFLHHLGEAETVTALREIGRVTRHGVVIADLLRHRRALGWITLLTAFSGPMVRHDARASVRQAYTGEEMRRLADAAGLAFARLYRHFGHRFVMAGTKRGELPGRGNRARDDTEAGEMPAPPTG